jgi:prepilin-type N-terminal cleavage/methylation domain-containing protein/prepilin-type processing-associated H-X9-DG protein
MCSSGQCLAFRRRRAFTLVELLVVIGIIGLLMSILLPTMGRVRERAKTIKCLSNMKQILVAAHAYSGEGRGVVLPAGTNRHGWWSNILNDFRYLPVETTTDPNRGPMMGGVLFCPAGNDIFFPPNLTNNTTSPANRTDDVAGRCWRSLSPQTQTYVDLWYGINAAEGSNFAAGPPCRRIQNYPSDGYIKMTQVPDHTRMVMFYDGLIYHHQNVNANRLHARHMYGTVTNLGFFDGHVESWPTKDLPGGIGAAQVSAFSVANLNANHTTGPKWRLDQRP